ncbi:hypothetical protein SO802_022506 [Lithocarpus litseifolius]|uniref:Uncharacterized protein n=1 Tax=Lithocarpus litseifolius TaxID=425828 RepID=A0AAW2C524_9ROSI
MNESSNGAPTLKINAITTVLDWFLILAMYVKLINLPENKLDGNASKVRSVVRNFYLLDVSPMGSYIERFPMLSQKEIVPFPLLQNYTHCGLLDLDDPQGFERSQTGMRIGYSVSSRAVYKVLFFKRTSRHDDFRSKLYMLQKETLVHAFQEATKIRLEL